MKSSQIPDVKEELDNKKHVHRFTLRTGDQVVSSVGMPTGNGKHVHTVMGRVSSADSNELNHTHDVFINGVVLTSGPSTWPAEAGFHKEEVVEKSLMPDLIDPEHEYVFKTGAYGIADYWYRDRSGNYWRYTNAPEDHEDFDEKAGVPLLDKNQPMPHTAPQYFAENGRKRHVAIPEEFTPAEINASYDPLDPKNTWYETYEDEEGIRHYVYLDSDVRENLDMWVQYQLRVTDAGMTQYRRFVANLFSNPHPKDKMVGAILMLVDQGLYDLESLADALVEDLEFVDETVKLLGRKFICDPPFYDFLTSIVSNREPSAPLFYVDTKDGRNSFGYNYLYSVFKFLKISPYFILYWRASQMFSRIMTRLALTAKPDPEEVEGRAVSELQRMFGTQENIKHLIDFKVREQLMQNYEDMMSKALVRQEQDDYGVVTVWSDLIDRREDEKSFSEWLHTEPMHDISPEEEAELEAQLAEAQEDRGEEQQPGDQEEEGLTDTGGKPSSDSEESPGMEPASSSPTPEGGA